MKLLFEISSFIHILLTIETKTHLNMKLLLIFAISFFSFTCLSQTWYEEYFDTTYEGSYYSNDYYFYLVDELHCSFDTTCLELTIDTTNNDNLWQITTPQKNYFDTAFINSKAILTDSTSTYSTNNLSFFEIDLGNFYRLGLYSSYIIVEFDHKIDTDTLNDGGFLYSYYTESDSARIIEDFTENQYGYKIITHNWYEEEDTLYDGSLGFSGKNDWETAGVILDGLYNQTLPENTPFPKLRFYFQSDSLFDDKDGWMIDNIKVYFYCGHLSSTNDVESKKGITIFPNPVSQEVSINIEKPNFDTYDVSIINSIGKIVLEQNQIQNTNITLNISDFKSGLYHVLITQEGKLISKEKLVVK